MHKLGTVVIVGNDRIACDLLNIRLSVVQTALDRLVEDMALKRVSIQISTVIDVVAVFFPALTAWIVLFMYHLVLDHIFLILEDKLGLFPSFLTLHS